MTYTNDYISSGTKSRTSDNTSTVESISSILGNKKEYQIVEKPPVVNYELSDYSHLSRAKQDEARRLQKGIIMARERLEILYKDEKQIKRKKIKLKL